jgi:hypothetical protein
MELKQFSSKELNNELIRRKSLGIKPQQKENPDLTELRDVTSKYIDSIYDGTDNPDSNIEHDIYEAAMEALYEEGIFDWMNNNT